jgi:hypothetical protein
MFMWMLHGAWDKTADLENVYVNVTWALVLMFMWMLHGAWDKTVDCENVCVNVTWCLR